MNAFENPERVTSFADQNPRREVVTMRTYDDIAEWYDRWVGTHSMREDPFFPACEQLMGEVKGARICDLARGQRGVARHLADLGARVVGIDLSAKLLTIVRRHEEASPRGIAYVQTDARSLDSQALGTFDGGVKGVLVQGA